MSRETWEYDDASDGAWTIHEETVARDPDSGEMVVALDRRVGTAPLSASELPFAEHLCAEAFESHDDHLCVPRQVAALLALDFGLVCNEFEILEQKAYGTRDMHTKGCTPRLVLEFAKERGLGCAILHNGALLEQYPGPNPLVCALHADHLYFYKGRVRKKLLGWNSKPTTAKLRREHQSSAITPSAHEWQQWAWKLAPGHFCCAEEEIAGIRAWFLAGGRSPRVLLKDAGSVRTIVYNCTAKDSAKGNVCVHAVPIEFEQIKSWLEELALGIKYTGQGLPAISAQVFSSS